MPAPPPPPIPCAIVESGQRRCSADGSHRAHVKAAQGKLWRVRVDGATCDGWNTAAVIVREWPCLVGDAAPAAEPAAPDARVGQILAGRPPLLGVALTFGDHARRKASRRRGRAGA